MDNELFREKVQDYRRPTGHSQQELADILGIQRQVLARKFSGSNNARFTHAEVKQIIKSLAEWDAITQRAEAHELLALMGLPPTSFSPTEWATLPLAKLENEATIVPSVKILGQLNLPHQLPVPLTGLIGRDWLIRLVMERLMQPQVRLLTLVGPGGIGKTRLSLEVGQRLLSEFKQAVYFIDLSSLTNPAQVPVRLAQLFGIPVNQPTRIMDELKKYLANRRLLLILDNFEQILPAANLVSQWLEAAPHLKLLVTSRAVLQIYGESELGVPSLDLPDLAQLPAPADFEALLQFEAIQLFVARVQSVQPTFRLNPTNYQEVAKLCVLLEGLPLSLELAAARVKLMPLSYLYERLSESRLNTLSKGGRNLPERQQTLRATLDWSYGLLEEEARRLFNYLGIFRGSFNLSAVEQICYGDNPPPDLLESLSSLVDQSLLKPVEGATSEPRFVMLETMREYAVQKLHAAGEFEEVQGRYLYYYLNLVEKLSADFQIDPDDREGLTAQLEEDFDNFQAAQYLAEASAAVEQEKENERQPVTKVARPVQVQRSILIRRPVEEVFSYICVPENWPRWNSLIKECYALEPGPLRVGGSCYAVSSLLGRRQEQTMVVSAYLPNQLLEVKTLAGPFEVVHRLTFSNKAGSTELIFCTTNSIGQLFRFTRPVLTHVIGRAIENQMNRLKTVLEENR